MSQTLPKGSWKKIRAVMEEQKLDKSIAAISYDMRGLAEKCVEKTAHSPARRMARKKLLKFFAWMLKCLY